MQLCCDLRQCNGRASTTVRPMTLAETHRLPPSLDGSAAHPRADAVAGLTGVEKLKTGFGGEIVTVPQTMERTYHPRLTRIARSFQE